MKTNRYTGEGYNEKILNDLYDWEIRNPRVWVDKSQLLKSSADSLFEEALVYQNKVYASEKAYLNAPREEVLKSHYTTISMMLYGYSLECVLKAILLYKHRENSNEELRRYFKHDLEWLHTKVAEEVSPKYFSDVTDEDTYLLDRLTTFSIWSGRYPIPQKTVDMGPYETPLGGISLLSNVTSYDNKLVDRLYDIYINIIKDLLNK